MGVASTRQGGSPGCQTSIPAQPEAGTRKRGPRNVSEDDIPEEAPDRDSVNAAEHGDTGMDSGEAGGEDALEEQ